MSHWSWIRTQRTRPAVFEKGSAGPLFLTPFRHALTAMPEWYDLSWWDGFPAPAVRHIRPSQGCRTPVLGGTGKP